MPSPKRGHAHLAEEPPSWELGARLLGLDQLLALQQLLIKGLFRPETELATVLVLSLLAETVARERPPKVRIFLNLSEKQGPSRSQSHS